MMKKKICFIAQFPPPIHGLSKAVDTLYNSAIKDSFDIKKIDITNNSKFLSNIMKIASTNSDMFYFTISQTKGGNLRDLIILKLLKLRNKKCLIHLHGGYYKDLIDNDCGYIQRNLNYRIISGLNGVIILGKSLKYIFKNMIEDNKIFVVHNCVDNEFLSSDDKFQDKLVEIKDKKKLGVLYLSNFIESKGYKDVLKVAKVAKEKNITNLEFVFAGKFFKDEDKEWFYSFIETNQLHELVRYEGLVLGEKKKNILIKNDIFILPTRYPKEGQPISILEAMANGMCILTTKHAGIPDLVEDGENGAFIEYNEHEEILNEILKYNADRKKLEQIFINNRNKVKDEFIEEKYISNMYSIFNRILNNSV